MKTFSNLHHTKWTARIIHLSLILFSIINFQACGLDIEDPTPPSQPQWVQKSQPEEWPETGIDAHETGGIFLEWEDNPGDDIIVHNIYRAKWFETIDSLGMYELLASFDPEIHAQTQYIDGTVSVRTQYHYKMNVQNTAGNISDFSESVYYSLMNSPRLELMNPNGQGDTLEINRQLTWQYHYPDENEYFYLTVLTQENELIIRKMFLPKNYLSGTEFWQIPDHIFLEPGVIYKWHVDTAAKFENGSETSGSESQTASFLYVE
jgi:hypothetical protein